jgi:hypothetical protein
MVFICQIEQQTLVSILADARMKNMGVPWADPDSKFLLYKVFCINDKMTLNTQDQ